MFLLRDVHPDDIDQLQAIASLLNSINLPDDREGLARIVNVSMRSFSGTLDDPDDARYLFVLEEVATRRIVGTSMIIAAHGTPSDPHNYLAVDVDERFSSTLGSVFRHKTLLYKQSFTPHTELGALILHPGFRGHPARLGKVLSFVRFLYIAAHRERFKDTVQAELMPPLEPDGSSRFWEWLGRKFTGLDYHEADRLARHDHEFIKSLFPRVPIYVSLMPDDVRAVVAEVAPETRPVERMLKRIGFALNRNIDPFDGGPHYEAPTDAIEVVRDSARSAYDPASR